LLLLFCILSADCFAFSFAILYLNISVFINDIMAIKRT
jgi:hypothetical protein